MTKNFASAIAFSAALLFTCTGYSQPSPALLKQAFINPPDSTRPGVYWYFMDGNLSATGMTKDLESMKKAGIGSVLFLEVNVGIPRGKIDFLSPEWLKLFTHAVREAERLGITVTLGIGPGWSGSGGPWVPASQSMQDLVASSTEISGGSTIQVKLPVPQPRAPFFGYGVFTPELRKKWEDFYEDVAVLAFPTPPAGKKLEDIDELALYYRAPYSSQPGVKPYLPTHFPDSILERSGAIPKNGIVDLTKNLQADGSLHWNAPAGQWTILRFGKRNNGAITRPAPVPGLGFECDKFDTTAFAAHLDAFTGQILRTIGQPDPKMTGGLKYLHMDSWEMGAQNWTGRFRDEFIQRRGYDPLPYYPVYLGFMVESPAVSERFLWDLRQTSSELIVAHHAEFLKAYAHKNGLRLSIEPYDMNPSADMELGAVADMPMAEFWTHGDGFSTSFSCIQAASIAHVNGQPTVGAEAFTAQGSEGWKQHPGSMKDQGDWAFATGINKFFFHTFSHQPFADSLRPGMTMGGIGIHWDRGQTWWPLAYGYHQYVSRCSYLLRQGRSVADILYLTPEGAPQVFRAPPTALSGDPFMADRREYNFDGCSPGQLFAASIKDHQIVFPGGTAYRILVLPAFETMTPGLLQKIRSLIAEGATIIGNPPTRSPGLTGYPGCDRQIEALSKEVWGGLAVPESLTEHPFGRGRIFWGGELNKTAGELYPAYEPVARLLADNQIKPDFIADTTIRYTHRATNELDIYFVANRTGKRLTQTCLFRSDKGAPQLWDPQIATVRSLPEYSVADGQTRIPMVFDAYQSFFVIFPKQTSSPLSPSRSAHPAIAGKHNFPAITRIAVLNKPWSVSFDPTWGGPANIVFNKLIDWTSRPEDGIRYYSGKAFYKQRFDAPPGSAAAQKQTPLYLDLGEVRNIAHVILNGHDLGIVWTSPWRVDITGFLKPKANILEIEVVNLWPNRLIGDERLPDDGIADGHWPGWLLQGKPRPSKRYTFTTARHYGKTDPLLPSGLIGPVTICW